MLARRRAVCLAALLAFLAAPGCTMWKKPPEPGWKSATSAEEYERLMWKAVQAGDWEQVNAHMAESFLGATPAGVRDRAATLQHLQQIKIADYSLGDFETRPAGADMVVSYVITVRGTVAGQPLPAEPMRVVTVWQTVRHGWIQIAQTVMPVAAPR